MATAEQTLSPLQSIIHQLRKNWRVLIIPFGLFLIAAISSSLLSGIDQIPELSVIPDSNRFVIVMEAKASAAAWWDGFLQNFGTEMIGAILTFILIETVVGMREKEESEQAEKARTQEIKAHVDQALVAYQRTLDEQERRALINQLSSTVPGLPAEAVRLLRHKGWLEFGDIAEGLRAGGDFYLADLREVVLDEEVLFASKLSQTFLSKANMKGVHLRVANLVGAHLISANLVGADLTRTNLVGADLYQADLEGAKLTEANLERAFLLEAHLEGTILHKANLERADLMGANLERAREATTAQLGRAKSLQGVTLPEGTKLPDDNTWRKAFMKWRMTVPVDEHGYIIVDD